MTYFGRWFATWVSVKDMTLAGDTVTAETIRSVRIFGRVFQWETPNLLGFVKIPLESVKWMEKGSFISYGSTHSKVLNREYRAFSKSGFESYASFDRSRAATNLLNTLKKS